MIIYLFRFNFLNRLKSLYKVLYAVITVRSDVSI